MTVVYHNNTPSLLQGANNSACRIDTPTRILRPIRQACKTWCKVQQKTPTPRVGDRVALMLEQHSTISRGSLLPTAQLAGTSTITENAYCTETVSVQGYCSTKNESRVCPSRLSRNPCSPIPCSRRRSGNSIIPSFFLWPEVEHDAVMCAVERVNEHRAWYEAIVFNGPLSRLVEALERRQVSVCRMYQEVFGFNQRQQ